MTRKIRWRLRQLVPTKFATVSRQQSSCETTMLAAHEEHLAECRRCGCPECVAFVSGIDAERHAQSIVTPKFVRWWMWFGRCCRTARTAV